MRRLPRAVVVALVLAAALVLAPPAGAQTPAPAPPPPTPVSCAAQPPSHQFDFWVGEWDVTTLQGGHAGDSSVQKILGDCVVFENWHGARGAPTMLRMTFTPMDANTVRQFGERSKDGGQTWAAAYDLYYHRKG